jgi:hypothetical protein
MKNENSKTYSFIMYGSAYSYGDVTAGCRVCMGISCNNQRRQGNPRQEN